MRAIKIGGKIIIYDDSVETYVQLPPATYSVCYSDREGCYLEMHSDIVVSEKTYGVHSEKVKKVMKSFGRSDRSLGVILSGDKGIGKSMFAKLVCQTANAQGMAVIIVDSCVPGIARFIESIEQECIVLFDEFDKAFRKNYSVDEQASLLSLFDGTAGGKKLYMVTCNEINGLNSYIVNRPGRFHYHFRFEYPTPEDIREYLKDNLDPKYYSEIENVIEFSYKISLNYDCLRAIAFELNQGISFKDAILDLNILNVNTEEYNICLYLETGEVLTDTRHRADLFNNNGNSSWVSMKNNSGNYVLDVTYNKAFVTYDVEKKLIVIPREGLTLEADDYDNNERYRNVRAEYMTFSKCDAAKLHYVV